MADEEQHTGVGVFLLPEASDPIVEASSEPAHLTTVWLGDMNDLDEDTINAIRDEIVAYSAALEGPVVVPTAERGLLGDEDADVQFLERTEALVALREGLLEASPTVKRVMDSVEQYPEWTPHVTLGYPETPATGEYDGEAVTFDRVGLWIGPEQEEYPMSGKKDEIAASLAAARAALTAKAESGEIEGLVASGGGWTAPADQVFDIEGVEVEVDDDEMPLDELEEGEEYITEVPVHGVATVEGVPTGDGRGFRLGAIKFGPLPQPLGYEFESGHGSDNSRVAIIGRIDSYERHELGDGTAEIRWRGVIMPGKPYGALAIESIIDGSYTGLSVIVDAVTVDVEEEREALRARFKAERDFEVPDEESVESRKPTDEEIDAMVDEWVGDGTQPTTWYTDAQVRRFDMVPTGAFQQGYTTLGHEFANELTEEQLTAAARALEDCGCAQEITSAQVAALAEGQWAVEFSGEEGQGLYGPFATSEEADAWVGSLGDGEYEPIQITPALVASAAFAPGTKDGPGWITHPIPTSRIRRYWVRGKGAAKIRWGQPGDFNRCRAQLAKYVQNPEWLAGLCANMHKEALGVWPGQEGGGRHSILASAKAAPLVVMADAAVVEEHRVYPATAFQAPREGRAFGMRIDREARTIVGYAAQWGSCHIGISGICQTPPHSPTDYSFFRKGVVETDAGEQRVGLITAGIGHADEYMGPAAATAHYDRDDAVRAYINIGEDSYGIWYAGVLAPETTDAQIEKMRAIGRVSGDWRNWSGRRGDLEMVGLVCVNTEGFQLAASGGVQTAAIGLGALPAEDSEAVVADATLEDGAVATLDVVEMDYGLLAEKIVDVQEHRALVARVTPARAALEAHQLKTARSALSKITKE